MKKLLVASPIILAVSASATEIIRGDIEIHERYKNLSQLKNAAPETYLKKGQSCYAIPSRKTFLVPK